MDEEIRPLAVGLDKLCFGTNWPNAKTLREALAVCNDKRKEKKAKALSNVGDVHKYRFSINVGDETIYVGLCPHRDDAGHPKFVVDLNPRKLGAEGMKEVQVVLKEILGDKYEAAMSKAFVTRVDYFADYPVKVQEYFIEMTRKESCATWGLEWGGKWMLQTIYLGSGGSKDQLKVYDKAAEAIAASAKHERTGRIEKVFNEKGKEIGSRMRVEACKRLPKVRLSKVHELENPFARVAIAMIPADAKEFQEPMGRLLLLAARAWGWQVALNQLDVNDKRRYRRAFAKHKCNWWKPDEAAVDIGVALLRTGLFPKEAFDPRVVYRDRGTKRDAIRTFDGKELRLLPKVEKEQDERYIGLDEDDDE